MSVDIRIRQKGLLKKKLDLVFVNEMCLNHNLSFGVPNEAFALDDYVGDSDITNIEMLLYHPVKLGRGFTFMVEENGHDCSLRINNPSTDKDIKAFFRVVKYVCDKLNANTYERDETEIIKVSEIATEEQLITDWNAQQLFETANREDNLTIYGALYPISIEPETIQHWRNVDRAFLMSEFSAYLHEKQSVDYYYAMASIFKNDKEQVMGSYAVPEAITTIFPLTPNVPLAYGINTIKVDFWRVSLGIIAGDGYEEGANVEFTEFIEKCQIDKKVHFDNDHVIVKLTRADIDNLLK